jgi:hypothetical protein
VATSPRRRPGWPSTATWASESASTIGETFCTDSRWFGVSMKPPVPGVEASRKVSGETQVALPVVLITSLSPTP